MGYERVEQELGDRRAVPGPRRRQVRPAPPETFEELRTFVHGRRGKLAALPGKHDDRVMALALANVAAKEASALGELVFF